MLLSSFPEADTKAYELAERDDESWIHETDGIPVDQDKSTVDYRRRFRGDRVRSGDG